MIPRTHAPKGPWDRTGNPTFVRCYDNGGKTADRYTLVFYGRYRRPGEPYVYVTMCERPRHPQGVCTVANSDEVIDQPAFGRLGSKVAFGDLPADAQAAAKGVYESLWGSIESICEECRAFKASKSREAWNARGGCRLPARQCVGGPRSQDNRSTK